MKKKAIKASREGKIRESFHEFTQLKTLEFQQLFVGFGGLKTVLTVARYGVTISEGKH